MYKPWRVCLKIGDDVVASNVHYESQEVAKGVQQKLLSSHTLANTNLAGKCKDGITSDEGVKVKVSVVVMHWKTFRRLCNEGTGVTIKRLQDNERRYGKKFAMLSPQFRRLSSIRTQLAKELG